MAKKEKKAEAKAPEKKATTKAKVAMTAEEKAAKRKARMEAIKNRPAEQRTNSKQIDVIELGDGNVVKNFGYAVKQKSQHLGVVVTSIALHNDEVVSTSVTFVPGDLTVKSKKNHGTICAAKHKGAVDEAEAEDEDED